MKMWEHKKIGYPKAVKETKTDFGKKTPLTGYMFSPAQVVEKERAAKDEKAGRVTTKAKTPLKKDTARLESKERVDAYNKKRGL